MTVPGKRRSAATAAVINIIIIINYISHSRIFSNIMTGSREFTYDMKAGLRETMLSYVRTE